MPRSTVVLLALAVAGAIVLSGLGAWQLMRNDYKRDAGRPYRYGSAYMMPPCPPGQGAEVSEASALSVQARGIASPTVRS